MLLKAWAILKIKPSISQSFPNRFLCNKNEQKCCKNIFLMIEYIFVGFIICEILLKHWKLLILIIYGTEVPLYKEYNPFCISPIQVTDGLWWIINFCTAHQGSQEGFKHLEKVVPNKEYFMHYVKCRQSCPTPKQIPLKVSQKLEYQMDQNQNHM